MGEVDLLRKVYGLLKWMIRRSENSGGRNRENDKYSLEAQRQID